MLLQATEELHLSTQRVVLLPQFPKLLHHGGHLRIHQRQLHLQCSRH
jgi:hypothetical protein